MAVDVVSRRGGLQQIGRGLAERRRDAASAGQVAMRATSRQPRLSEDVFDAVEQALVVLLADAASARTASFGSVAASCSSSFFCSLVSFFGVMHLHGDEQVAAAAAADVGHAAAAQPERRAGLRALGNRERLVAVERRNP